MRAPPRRSVALFAFPLFIFAPILSSLGPAEVSKSLRNSTELGKGPMVLCVSINPFRSRRFVLCLYLMVVKTYTHEEWTIENPSLSLILPGLVCDLFFPHLAVDQIGWYPRLSAFTNYINVHPLFPPL